MSVQFLLMEIKLEIDRVYLNVLSLVSNIILLKINPEFVWKSAKMILGDFNLQENVLKIPSIVVACGLIIPLIFVLLLVLKLLARLAILQPKHVFLFAQMDPMLMILQELVLQHVQKIVAMVMIHLLIMILISAKKFVNKMELLLILKLETDIAFWNVHRAQKRLLQILQQKNVFLNVQLILTCMVKLKILLALKLVWVHILLIQTHVAVKQVVLLAISNY